MISLLVGRKWLVVPIVLGLLVSVASSAPEDDPQAKQRLQLMQEAVRSFEPEASELKSKSALMFASKPLLRYSDPTRGGADNTANVLLDASVWRLGADGRPTALVTVEIYQVANSSNILALEFLSLSKEKFTLKHKTKSIRWDPSTSALTLKQLPEAPKPAATAAARLVQMRRLARRFAAKERIKKEAIECRLLPQPIDRYQAETEHIVDGAIFAYANGTNPELGVILECDGKSWRYGTLRFTSAESSIALDGRQVAAYEHLDARKHPDSPYFSAFYKIAGDK